MQFYADAVWGDGISVYRDTDAVPPETLASGPLAWVDPDDESADADVRRREAIHDALHALGWEPIPGEEWPHVEGSIDDDYYGCERVPVQARVEPGMAAWLGEARDDLTADQIARLRTESDRLDAAYPHPDQTHLWAAAMSAAVQYILGETTIDDAGRALTAARLAQAEALAASQQIAAMAVGDGMSEVQAADRARIDRMTVRKVLGKR